MLVEIVSRDGKRKWTHIVDRVVGEGNIIRGYKDGVEGDVFAHYLDAIDEAAVRER